MRFETAWLEAQQGFPFKAQPMTLCGYSVDCEDLADLTDAPFRAPSRQGFEVHGRDQGGQKCRLDPSGAGTGPSGRRPQAHLGHRAWEVCMKLFHP